MTDRQFPWDVLGIDETDDKKLIKKAYAVLIKQFKPDEDPDKFKEIQEAYQYALQILKNTLKPIMRQNINSESNNTIASDVDITHIEIHDDNKHTISNIKAESYLSFLQNRDYKSYDNCSSQLDKIQKPDEHAIYNSHSLKIKEALYLEFDNMIKAPTKIQAKEENWHFLKNYFDIENLNIRKEIELDMFKNIGYLNQRSLEENKTLIINESILKYFDSIFNWTTNWIEYSNKFPNDIYILNFDLLLNNPNIISNKAGSRFITLRIQALFIDYFLIPISLVLVSIFPVMYFNIKINETWLATYILLSTAGVRLLMELLTKNHFTIGKNNYKLTVLNKNCGPCTKKQILIRHSVFNLQFIVFIILDEMVYHNKLEIFHLLFAIVFISNGISFLTWKKFIHDLASQTTIIQMKHS